MDLENVDLVRSKRMGAMSPFFIPTGAYTLSFCKLSGGSTVKTF